MSTWRERARPIIEEVIRETGRDDMALLRKKLREAYPFGPKKYHPYKVWLDEIKRQLGKKKTKIIANNENENQLKLFE